MKSGLGSILALGTQPRTRFLLSQVLSQSPGLVSLAFNLYQVMWLSSRWVRLCHLVLNGCTHQLTTYVQEPNCNCWDEPVHAFKGDCTSPCCLLKRVMTIIVAGEGITVYWPSLCFPPQIIEWVTQSHLHSVLWKQEILTKFYSGV